MKKILFGCLLLFIWAGCPDPFVSGSKDRPEHPGDPNFPRPDPQCQFCGARGFKCCPRDCREVSGQLLNSDFCLYNLRCMPVTDGGEKACVD